MVEQRADRSGQVLGPYQLTRFLGAGGFGEVYEADHRLLQQKRAIKLLLERHFHDPNQRERFLREARTLATLEHQNVLPLLEVGEEGTVLYLVMPFYRRGTLHNLLKQRTTPLPLTEVERLLGQMCAAVDYAHGRHIAHLDLKPQNMLMHDDGRLVVSDFGLAHLLKEEGLEGGTSLEGGTPHYMAPEHIEGHPKQQSDVYALGVILHQMLVGHLPFEGNPFEVVAKRLREEPPPLRKWRPELPQELEEVVKRALAREVRQRYQSAGELLKAFENALVHAKERLREEEKERVHKAERARKEKEMEQATIYPFEQPAQTPILPTVPARLTRRDLGGAAPAVPPPTPLVTQPIHSPTRGPNPTHTKKEPEMPRISRREAIIWGLGIAGTFAAIVGYGANWYIESHPSNLLYTYRGHSDTVNAVAWSHNSQRIASASGDKTVQVWDAASGGHIYTYRGHSGSVFAVAWSPNGQGIASVSGDVQVWDAASGGHIYTYRFMEDTSVAEVTSIAWSPDSTRIASGGGNILPTVKVWDATSGDHVSTYIGHSKSVDAVSWSPDGKYIASASSDSTVQVWNATTGEHVYTYNFTDPDYGICTMAWSPTSQHIALGTRSIDTVQVWDATTGRHVSAYTGHSNGVLAVAWSKDGQHIASASADNTVQVWIAATGDHVYTYPGSDTVAWSPNGKLIASGGTEGRTVEVWSAG